jgi:pyruvate/2-oxoglutarate dehydrogenase complex dihydrolipoamide dehydrogenase (E3) component
MVASDARLPEDPHDRALVEAVAPPKWEAPAPAERYDLVVVGAGTAGLVTALGAAGLGRKVALVERHRMGGDCLNTGCVPSKALIRSAHAAAEVRGAAEHGVFGTQDARVDFGAVMERMRRLRASIAPHDGAARLRDLGVDVFFGQARFISGDAVEVEGRRLAFRRACIATGARPARPPIEGLEEVPEVHTSDTIFDLRASPGRLAVVGAGPIGCELAQTFARLGAEVTLVESANGVLPREDAEAAAVVDSALRADGVSVHCCSRVARFSMEAAGAMLHLQSHGEDLKVPIDAVLLATGRTPNLEGLDLEKAGVESTPRGVVVDDHLRTTNRRIFAAGDVCTALKFTHAADAMARIVIRNAFFGWVPGRPRASRLVIPRVTYTAPEVAQVGGTAEELRAAGRRFETVTVDLGDVDRAVLDGDGGLLRVHVDRRGRILGATLVGAHAGESISELTLAMVLGVPLHRIAAVVHAYPTQAEAIKRAADLQMKARLLRLRDDLTHPWRLLGIGRPPFGLSSV